MLMSILNFLNFGPAGGEAPAAAQSSTTTAVGGGMSSLWIIVIMFILMYVLLFLPQKRQEKKHREMLNSLKKGDKIITSSGIIAKIVSISNDKIRVRTADKTELDFTKSAIAQVMSKPNTDDTKEKAKDKENTKEVKEEKEEKNN